MDKCKCGHKEKSHTMQIGINFGHCRYDGCGQYRPQEKPPVQECECHCHVHIKKCVYTECEHCTPTDTKASEPVSATDDWEKEFDNRFSVMERFDANDGNSYISPDIKDNAKQFIRDLLKKQEILNDIRNKAKYETIQRLDRIQLRERLEQDEKLQEYLRNPLHISVRNELERILDELLKER